jgi:hypothetical protein
MFSVITPSVVLLSVVMLMLTFDKQSIIMLSAILLSGAMLILTVDMLFIIMLSVILLIVLAPRVHGEEYFSDF